LAAISRGEPSAGVNPRISEWGNPIEFILDHPRVEFIDARAGTRGTETSQYPEEKR
jgi:hypothetical protein